MWKTIKNVFGLDTVGTIIKARIKMLAGLASAGLASVSAYSFLPFISDTVNWVGAAAVGAYLFIDGVMDEIVRRWNATDV